MNAPKEKKPPESFEYSLKKPMIYSAVLHLTVLILLTVGLPFFVREPELQEMAITVELAELSEVSQTPVVDRPHESKEKEPEPPAPIERKPVYKQEEQQEESKPDDFLTPEKPVVEEVPEPPEEKPPEPEKKEEPKPKPPPKPVVKPKPPKPKEEKPKEEVKKEEPKKEEKDFNSLLKSLTPEEQTPQEPVQAPPKETPTDSQTSQQADYAKNLTRTEEDDLNRGVQPCWNVNAGGKFAENLIVSLRVYVGPDLRVTNVEIIDQIRYASDPHYQAAADAARRALLNETCRTLRLPPEKYEQWKVFKYNFDPSMML